jgi:hypothetical protein
MPVLIGFDGGSVLAIFPERSLPILALVIFLRGATRDQLDALRYHISDVLLFDPMPHDAGIRSSK